MNFDVVYTSPTNTYEYGYQYPRVQFQERGGLSCAFGQVRGKFSNNEEDAWKEFCFILSLTKRNKRATILPITEREPLMLSLLESCPYAKPVACAKSRHGNYLAYIYVVEVP